MQVDINKDTFYVVIVHRTPSSSLQQFMDYMESQLTQLPSSAHCFVMGDFNIDMKNRKNVVRNNFCNLMYSFNLHPVIDVCTHITETSETFIDNIFSSVKYDSPIVIPNDVSDHCSIMVCIDIEKDMHNDSENRNRQYSYFDKSSINEMKERFEECDWSCLSECANYGDRFALWYEKVTNLINEVCIKTTITKKNERSAKKPWISPQSFS